MRPELKQIFDWLKKDDAKLDAPIQSYDRGAHTGRHCEQKLKEAEAMIETIRVSCSGSSSGDDGSGGEVSTEPLGVE